MKNCSKCGSYGTDNMYDVYFYKDIEMYFCKVKLSHLQDNCSHWITSLYNDTYWTKMGW